MATGPPQQDQTYQAVVMETAHEEEEEQQKKGKAEKLSIQQQLYKWARSGDSKKLKEFIREQQQTRELDIKEFLSWADDGTHDEDDTTQDNEKKGCGCGGDDDDDEFAIPKFKPYKSGNTALHFAALHANAEFCKDLFELGAKFTDVKNKLNSSPLHLAAASGDPETVRFILAKYVSGNRATALKEKNKIGNTPIHCAVYANSIPTLKLLFEACEQEDIDVKEALMDRNHTGTQALRYAASPEMKHYINLVFNPDLGNEQKENENDNDNMNDNDNDVTNENEENIITSNETNENDGDGDTTQASTAQEVDS